MDIERDVTWITNSSRAELRVPGNRLPLAVCVKREGQECWDWHVVLDKCFIEGLDQTCCDTCGGRTLQRAYHGIAEALQYAMCEASKNVECIASASPEFARLYGIPVEDDA